MASAAKAPCATCGNKGAGIFRCEGCVQVFCRKHLNEHRDILSQQLDEIVLEHDTLQQTIAENKDKKSDNLPVMKQIDKWEKRSIEKIQQMAEEARQQVKNLTSSQKVSKELHELAERLQKARVDDDYVETDLRTWTSTIQKLKDNVYTFFPSITIDEDPAQVLVGKIHVCTTITKHSSQGERFGESNGPIRIEENGRVAIHSGPGDCAAHVRGTSEYSSGKHNIRFVIKKISTDYITWFEVVSKLLPVSEVFSGSEYSSYGWDSTDTASGDDKSPVDKDFQDMSGETTFEIELRLDCDNHKISYFNQRTKNKRELNINMTECPFPWQIQFYLFEVGDSVWFQP